MLDDHVAEANNAFGRLFGHELSDVLGRPLIDFVAPESRDAVARQISLATEKPYDARGRRKDGSTFDIELTIRRITFRDRAALVTVAAPAATHEELALVQAPCMAPRRLRKNFEGDAGVCS